MIVLTTSIILTAILIDIVLIALYSTTSSYRVCHYESCANNLRKFVDLLLGFIRDCPCCRHHPHHHPYQHHTYHIILYNFPLSVTSRAALTISRSTAIFLLHLIRDCPHSRHHHWMQCSWVLALDKLSVVNRCTLNVINRTRLS